MGGGGGEMARQAARLQRKLDEARKGLKDREVSHSQMDDKVKVTVTCEGRVRGIEVAPELLESEGLEMTLDVITAAVNAALQLAEDTTQAEYDKITGGVRLPGMM